MVLYQMDLRDSVQVGVSLISKSGSCVFCRFCCYYQAKMTMVVAFTDRTILHMADIRKTLLLKWQFSQTKIFYCTQNKWRVPFLFLKYPDLLPGSR